MLSALLLVLAAQAIDPPVPDRVTISRGAVCTGSVDYRIPLRDAQVRALSGDAFRSLAEHVVRQVRIHNNSASVTPDISL
jgi:hypothetical protein